MSCSIQVQDITVAYKKYDLLIPLPSAKLLLNFFENDRYHNIIYEFEISAMHILLKIFEEKGCFETCVVLKKSIEKHNQLTGNNYQTEL